MGDLLFQKHTAETLRGIFIKHYLEQTSIVIRIE